MIQLYKYIKESLLDDEDVLMNDTSEEVIKEVVKKFLKKNYINGSKCKISKNPINGKYIVDYNGNLEVKNKNITSLTNEYFELGVIGRVFDCSFCNSLKSLKGAPKEVGGSFYCYGCSLLTSLEGAPEKVDGDFNCEWCDSLTSLEGAPKKIGRDFYCYECKTKFTEEDVRNVSNVGGNIEV